MIRYFDASALVKRYVKEEHSETVRRLISKGRPATSRLSEVEIASALVRRCREGDFSTTERDRVLTLLRKDFHSIHVVELVPPVIQMTYTLLLRHRLRASDALQLASCLYLKEQVGSTVRFIAYDGPLNEAAETEGLKAES